MEIKLTEEERKIEVTDPEKIFPIFQKIYEREENLGLRKEHLWVVGINYAGVLSYIELAALGSANKVAVKPVDIFQLALLRHASTIILVHNHPGGTLKFSPQDLDMTDHMIQVGKFHNIDVVDHLIITNKEYTSLRQLGIYDELYNSPKYLTDYIKYEIEMTRARREAREQVMRMVTPAIVRFYENNTPLEEIADLFALNVYEVKRILEID